MRKSVLTVLLPKILGEDNTYKFHPHQGKKDLLKKLPQRLRAYRKWIPDHYRIVVLVDNDRDDCRKLKRRLETIAGDAGFLTKTKAGNQCVFQVLNRILVKELEAWFFGDPEALVDAYPKLSAKAFRKKRFDDPDAISDTWEALEKILQRAGYYSGGLPKVETANKISMFMNPDRNRSRSFNVFIEGLSACLV